MHACSKFAFDVSMTTSHEMLVHAQVWAEMQDKKSRSCNILGTAGWYMVMVALGLPALLEPQAAEHVLHELSLCLSNQHPAMLRNSACGHPATTVRRV
jgi:hypothetical protein